MSVSSPSFIPSLKLRIDLPMPVASCGRRFAPKISTTMNRMMKSSGKPIRPMSDSLLHFLGQRDASHCTSKSRGQAHLNCTRGEPPFACREQPSPEAAVRLHATDQVDEHVANPLALVERPHKQG